MDLSPISSHFISSHPISSRLASPHLAGRDAGRDSTPRALPRRGPEKKHGLRPREHHRDSKADGAMRERSRPRIFLRCKRALQGRPGNNRRGSHPQALAFDL